VALAVSAFIVLTVGLRVLVPRRESLGPHWVVPAIELTLLVAPVDPARAGAAAPALDRADRAARGLGIGVDRPPDL
jgi:hypothetical protein